MTRRKSRLAVPGLILLSVVVVSPGAAAQACRPAAPVPGASTWAPPLDRRVVVHGRDISLREALDRVAAAARIQLSYSGDLLPLDRAVCAPSDSGAAGDVLAVLLRGSAVEPVVTGSDEVVLAPRHRPLSTRTLDTTLRMSVLDRVVVTGSTHGTTARPVTVALDVITGPELTSRDASSLSKALDATVPGLWLWEQSPSDLVARYGSIRGTSSFGTSSPKIYIDGIDVANPLLLTQLGPETIDRVEVIRGPQGAALYGADAISGVVNVVTRYGTSGAGGGRMRIRSDAGLAQSDYLASHGALVERQTLTVNGGTNLRSAGLTAAIGTMGDFVPDGYSRELKATGGFRVIGSRATVTGTGRFYGKDAGVPTNSLLVGPRRDTVMVHGLRDRAGITAADSVWSRTGADSNPQSIREYTLGITAHFAQSDRWSHSLVTGVDGYRLANVSTNDVPIPSAAESALHAAAGGADRGTLRLSSAGTFGGDGPAAATMTFALEHSALRERSLGAPIVNGRAGQTSRNTVTTLWRNNTGITAQSNASFFDALYLTGGMRVERDDALNGGAQLTTLPMFGAALVHDYGALTTKLRGAYGRGMRPVQRAAREIAWLGVRRNANAPPLLPEQQAGTEMGADLLLSRDVGIHVTRFDQHAFGLVQAVALADTAPSRGGGAIGPNAHGMIYELQNVGEIVNRGWELQSTAAHGPLSLSGALSLVDSRVTRLAGSYSGDLRPGDRMLAVPARTASGVATWTSRAWSASLTIARASDWVNYDRLALAGARAAGVSAHALSGPQLRSFWRPYPGVTHLNGSFSRSLPHGLSLMLSADNLLNEQRGEPDNLTIVPGRTVTAGLTAAW